MNLAKGAIGSILPKLVELLNEEYNLQTGVRKGVESLEKELRSIEAALGKVGRVPRDQLDEQVKVWADDVRELSYQMEDVVDSFLVRVDGTASADSDTFKGLMKKMTSLFKKTKARHQIANTIKDMREQVREVAARRDRYKVDAASTAATIVPVDPRMLTLFKDQRELVGINEPRDELCKRLMTDRDDGQQLKILSIFGLGGLGKTTLAKAVYGNLQANFVHKAFVSVGQNPDAKKVFMDILLQLDEESCWSATMLDHWQLIRKLRGLLENKRYLIVIDDIWDKRSWEIIRCAWIDSTCGSRIITTTRIFEVAEETGDVYKQQPLTPSRSKELFYKRLSIGKCKASYGHFIEISEKIIHKCGGVPLAIITIASLLASKPREDWSEVYNLIGFGHQDNIHVDNTRKILLYSYYDLPCHLRTCLLHLSIFPEDYEIQKDTLIWKWIAEDFVHEKPGIGLFELGERYFNELINRSMIQPVERPHEGIVYACRVHDLVLDMIYSLSKEENFLAILDSNEQHISSQNNARRLAIQKKTVEQHYHWLPHTRMSQVRSFNATMCHFSLMMPLLSSFKVLRVLALEGCTFTKDRSYHLELLGRLLHLRYLGLSNTSIDGLPEEIGELRFLQTLDLARTQIKYLPQSVGLLRQLKCLRLPRGFVGFDKKSDKDLVQDMTSVENFTGLHEISFTSTGVLDWMGNLTSLEELSVTAFSPQFFVKGLGKLTELRAFSASFKELEAMSFEDLMESIGNNLRKLQAIQVNSDSSLCIEWDNCEDYVPPRRLSDLALMVRLSRLPAWIESSRLPLLSHLELELEAVEAGDVEVLGRFPELVTLRLSTRGVGFPDVVGGGVFPKLRYFCTSAKPRFLPGAMPSLEHVGYSFWLRAEDAAARSLERDFASMGNLPCLEKVEVYIEHARAKGLEEAEAALRRAIKVHPNNPTLVLVSPYNRQRIQLRGDRDTRREGVLAVL